MEEKENYGFCPACGANLPENSTFCPECGHRIGDEQSFSQQSGAGYGYGYATDRSPMTRLQGKLLVAFIFVLIYGIMSIFGGLSLLTINDAFVDQLDQMLQDAGQGTFEEFMSSMGYNMTKSEFIEMCRVSAVVSLVSGALCIAANVFMYKHTKRIITTVLVAAAALVNFGTVTYSGFFSVFLNVVIGLIMAYLVYASSDSFKD
ncbi:MAG: zinc-ribbon domain-containing protein [Candidatus Methanomethylophilus sp.]|nr:zinc-ribbon domain-containing protein [Methanomethylophilus sp.]